MKVEKLSQTFTTWGTANMQYFFLISLSAVVFPFSAIAASFDFDTSFLSPRAGDSVEINLLIAPDGYNINALEGEIIIPDGLNVLGIRYGSSIVPVWLEAPILNNKKISFAGIIPSGWPEPADSKESGKILTFVLMARNAGNYQIYISSSTEVLLNDGLGSAADVKKMPFLLNIGESDISKGEQTDIFRDTIPPEPFTPIISRSDNLFNGDHFAVFNATDHESGLSRYEIAETRSTYVDFSRLQWRPARSPERLNDQTLSSKVYVKAIDMAGNERIAVIGPQKRFGWYNFYLFLGILLIIFVFRFFLKIPWQKFIR